MLSFCIFSPPSSPHSPLLSSAGLSPPMSLPAGLPPQVEMEALGENFSDEFQVDDLLDLRGSPEPEKEVVEEEEERGGASIDTDEKETSLLLSEISLPEETEAADLEWLSRFVDDCHSEYPQPLWLAPVLTARAKNLSSGVQLPPEGCRMNMAAFIPVKAKRSKRPRCTYAPWSLSSPLRLGDASPVSSIASSPSPSSSSSTLTSVLAGGNPASTKSQSPKKRGRKPKSHLSATAAAGGEGRCRHCGVQKTPQWRAGPLGPKTLCNACGVRYKSGRLLPEYRPAGSPTFVSKVHSNSHRKVLEMRRKKEQLFTASALPVPSC